MDDEGPRHRRIGGHHHSQQKRGIEDVAVHRRYIWKSAEEVWIPLRESLPRSQRVRGELAKCVAGDVLVAARIHEKGARERGIRARTRGERIDKCDPLAEAKGRMRLAR